MGRQKNLKFIGTQGNIIYYQAGNNFYIRTKPESVQQTTATKQSAQIFGKAARLSAALRKVLAPLLFDVKDRKMHLRFQTAIQQLLQQITVSDFVLDAGTTTLAGFVFQEQANNEAFLKNAVRLKKTDQQKLLLNIQSIDLHTHLRVPANTTMVALTYAVIKFDPAIGEIRHSVFDTIEWDDTDKPTDAKQITIDLPTENNNAVIAVVSLQFTRDNNGIKAVVQEKRWRQTMVVGVLMGV